MKLRITLKAKKDFGTTKIGETMILINEVFCLKTGIAFFSIPYEIWDVISYDQYTEMKDKNKNEIYNSDFVEGKTFPEEGEDAYVFGHVVLDEGAFCIDIVETKGKCGYDTSQKIPLYKFETLEIASLNN